MFQPRNGSIGIEDKYDEEIASRFNPATVRLELPVEVLFVDWEAVSTPQRFDWNEWSLHVVAVVPRFQPRNGSIGIHTLH